MVKRITVPERRKQLAHAAMPEVKRLVKKYGRQAIGNCLAKIHAWEREEKKLQTLKQTVASLEKRLYS